MLGLRAQCAELEMFLGKRCLKMYVKYTSDEDPSSRNWDSNQITKV